MDFRKQTQNSPASAAETVAADDAGKTLTQRLGATIGNSAEYAVAIALLAVVGVVGGAIWLLALNDAPITKSAPAPTAASAPVDPAQSKLQSEEQAALAQWQKVLANETKPLAPHVEKKPEPPPVVAPVTPAPVPVVPVPAAPPPVAMLTPKPAPPPARVAASFDRNSCRPPKYPDSAAQAGKEGQVVMGFLLDVGGRVTDSRIEQSSGTRVLDQTALNALGRCKFTAASVDGVAQGGWMQVRFKWQLGQ